MNKKDLDALKELYSSVYDGEQLNEAPLTPEEIKFRNERAQLGVIRQGGKFVTTGKTATDLSSPGEYMAAVLTGGNPRQRQQQRASSLANRLNDQERILRAQNAAIAAADKAEKTPPATTPVAAERQRPEAGSTPPPRPAATPPRPASGNVVSAKNIAGQQQKVTVGRQYAATLGGNKGTVSYDASGKRTFNKTPDAPMRKEPLWDSGTPKPSSPTPAAAQPKPATPAVGKLGNTSFERRTPTSAELRAAQKERAGGASPEKALQAAQKTNLPTTGPTPATPDMKSVSADLARANTPANLNRAPAGSAAAKALAAKPATSTPTPSQIAGASQGIKPATPGTNSINNTNPQKKEIVKSSYEWPSAKTIRDIAGAYASIYEAKKKVDQDQDGDNDFADVRVARMIASGVPKAKAIAMVKDKSYNEEVELWVNELLEEGYDLSEYTWEDMFEIYEATAMAKRGYDETEIRNKIAKSTGGGEAADRATELENRPTFGNKSKQASREKLARTQRGDFRRTTSSDYGLRLGAHKSNDPAVKAKQAARGKQRSALTPKEKKMLNREAYEAYEFVASYLLENNFAATVEDANVIINNMSENWFESIMEEKKPLPVAKMKRKEEKLDKELERELPKALRTEIDSPERKELLRKNRRFGDMHDVRRSVSTRGGKRPLQMPEVGRYKPKDED
jgi:hypothetical protein